MSYAAFLLPADMDGGLCLGKMCIQAVRWTAHDHKHGSWSQCHTASPEDRLTNSRSLEVVGKMLLPVCCLVINTDFQIISESTFWLFPSHCCLFRGCGAAGLLCCKSSALLRVRVFSSEMPWILCSPVFLIVILTT